MLLFLRSATGLVAAIDGRKHPRRDWILGRYRRQSKATQHDQRRCQRARNSNCVPTKKTRPGPWLRKCNEAIAAADESEQGRVDGADERSGLLDIFNGSGEFNGVGDLGGLHGGS